MESINYLEIIPNEVLYMITAHIPAPYSYIFVTMTCKDIALRLSSLIKYGDKPLKKLCEIAAKDGHLEVLIWARQNGCNWDWRTCANAAKNGHQEVIKWARQNGCEWKGLSV
jgi:hypothetical protein